MKYRFQLIKPVFIALLTFFIQLSACTFVGPRSKPALSSADSQLLGALRKKATLLQYVAPDSSLIYRAQIRNLYRVYNNVEADMNYFMDAIYIHAAVKKDTLKGRLYADSATLLTRQPDNEYLQHKSAYGWGIYYMALEYNDSAIDCFLDAVRRQPEPVDSVFWRNVYARLSQLYLLQKNYAPAIRYYTPLLEVALASSSNPADIAMIINAYTYYKFGNAEQKQEAYRFLYRAKQLADSFSDRSFDGIIYAQLGDYYVSKDQGDSGIYFAKQSIEAVHKSSMKTARIEVPYMLIIDQLIRKGKYEEAASYFNAWKRESDTARHTKEMKYYYYHYVYELKKHQGHINEALSALEKMTEYGRQLQKEEKDEQLLMHERLLKQLAAEKLIARKNKEIAYQQVLNLLLLVISVLLVLAIVFIYLYWKKKKNLEVQRLQYLQQEQEFAHQKMLLDERNRIAQEMHDDLGATLTSTFMAIEMLKEKPGDMVSVRSLEQAVQHLSQQINDVIWNLNLRNDNLFSLIVYILRFARSFMQASGIVLEGREQIDTAMANIDIPGYKRRVIYLSIKELLNNIVKHAHTTTVALEMLYEDNALQVHLTDDGIGMPDNLNASGDAGYGIGNIRKGIERIGGRVTWYPNPLSSGTRVDMYIPL